MTVTPFQIHVSDDVLADLRARLTRTLFTSPSGSACWAAGTDPGYLRDLVAYWADGFDWRAAEAALNAVPQFTAEVAGRTVHFAHLRGRRAPGGPAPLPLVLSHGWPGSFIEMLRAAPLLTDPDDPADAFDVVVPSLPGFLYSDLPQGPFTRQAVARVWHELMTETLGYPRYGAFGGDIGGGVTQWLGALYPGPVAGVHLTSAPMADEFPDRPATPDEQAYLDALQAYDLTDQGYSEIMWTRPDTIAAALADSPAGLAAWIVDKYRDWSDCGGDVTRRWDRDTLLTVLTLYWATGCIGSSFRSYYNYAQNPPAPQIVAPTAVTLSNEPAYAGFPRSLAERRCADLRHWSTPERGGHFMAHEEPEQVARELREFFRPLRA
ncbi:MAG: epoxide hydrolase family protein [Streptosporangiaceae bacterium]